MPALMLTPQNKLFKGGSPRHPNLQFTHSLFVLCVVVVVPSSSSRVAVSVEVVVVGVPFATAAAAAVVLVVLVFVVVARVPTAASPAICRAVRNNIYRNTVFLTKS